MKKAILIPSLLLLSLGVIILSCKKESSIISTTGITLSKSTINLGISFTDTLVATVSPSDATTKTFTWKSSNSTIATVNSSGIVTGINNGIDTITATTNQGNLKAICIVTVNDLAYGLVAYYPFNGDALDHSGNNNNGKVYGTLTPTIDHKGNANAAYSFDGVSNYIDIPDAPSLNPTTQITVSAWYQPVAFAGDGFDAIVSKQVPNAISPYYQYQLGVTGSEYANTPSHFGFSVGLFGPHGQPNTFNNGTWYHLVGTYDGTNVIMYVNGVVISTVTGSGLMQDYSEDIFIGREGNYNTYYQQYFYLPGSLSEIRIYNRALSQSEVTALYQF